jgi:hypothetical protein
MNIALPKGPDGVFADEAYISAQVKEAANAVYAAGILSGKQGGLFDPQGSVTRAEAAASFRSERQ